MREHERLPRCQISKEPEINKKKEFQLQYKSTEDLRRVHPNAVDIFT